MSYILFIYHQYKHDISCNARMYTIISLIMILVDLIHSTTYFNSLVVNAYDISCNARIHTHFSDLNSPQQLFNSIYKKWWKISSLGTISRHNILTHSNRIEYQVGKRLENFIQSQYCIKGSRIQPTSVSEQPLSS